MGRLIEVRYETPLNNGDFAMVIEKSDFGKKVADVYRGLKEHVEKMPVISTTPGTTPEVGAIDHVVKEQVIGDIDGHIRKNEES
jgi:hypothetical protein